MKRVARFSLIFALLCGGADRAQAETIKLATIAPKGSPYHDILREMGEAWRRIGAGAIELRIYAGGAAGDESDIIRKMRVGQFQAVAVSGGGLADILPELRALQMPMLFASDAERDYVFDRIHPQLAELAERRGFKILAWAPTGWLYFFTQKPVVSPDDLRPLGIFAWAGNSGYIEGWKAAGFRPVPLPVTEILTSLQTGLVNAVAVPPIVALSFQWFGLANHMSDLKWAPLDGAIVMPLAAWKALPPELRPKLLEAAEESGAKLARSIQALSDEAVAVMQRHGLVVHRVPPDMVPEWEKRARAGYPYIVGDLVPAEMTAEVERLRDEYRAAHPQH
jgi:TRAP-type C4-dicarboxylate transport system substrate-binding protein